MKRFKRDIDDLEMVFVSGFKLPSDREVYNDYTDLYVATLTAFKKIIIRSAPKEVLDFAQTICKKIIEKKILKHLDDNVCDAALKFLSQVVSVQANEENRHKKYESKIFWELLFNDGLRTALHVISNQIMQKYIESKNSANSFFSKLDSLM